MTPENAVLQNAHKLQDVLPQIVHCNKSKSHF